MLLCALVMVMITNGSDLESLNSCDRHISVDPFTLRQPGETIFLEKTIF